MNRTASLAAALLLALVPVVGCGGDDQEEDSAESPATTTEAEATAPEVNRVDLVTPPGGEWIFEPDTATAAPGNLTVVWDNEAGTRHNICMEDAQGKQVFPCSEPIVRSNVTTPTKVKPGKYTYYCSVDGHRAAGMEGTLTVE